MSKINKEPFDMALEEELNEIFVWLEDRGIEVGSIRPRQDT